MLESTQRLSLFPSLMLEYDLREYYDKDDLMYKLYEIVKDKKLTDWGLAPNTITSYTNEQGVLNHLPELKKKIMWCVNDYAKIAGFKSQKLSNSWFNISIQEGSVMQHIHPGCDVSATFYPVFPEGSANLVMHRLVPDIDLFRKNHVGTDTAYNNSEYELNIKEGHLYVWPAWMTHSSRENNSDERVVIALNTIKIRKK